jgi:hypothetical protein
MVAAIQTRPLVASVPNTRTKARRSSLETPSTVSSSFQLVHPTASGGARPATPFTDTGRPLSNATSCSASAADVSPSAASSGHAPGSNRARASASREVAPAAGRNTVQRQNSTPSTPPGRISVGSSPARISDDLPTPLAP